MQCQVASLLLRCINIVSLASFHNFNSNFESKNVFLPQNFKNINVSWLLQLNYSHHFFVFVFSYNSRCKDSHKSEAFLPCRIALWRVQMIEFWQRYQTWIEVSIKIKCFALTIGRWQIKAVFHWQWPRQNVDVSCYRYFIRKVTLIDNRAIGNI